jgi:hypothetical protein
MSFVGTRVDSAPSRLLSRLDCGSPENVRSALHQLRRCAAEADFSLWARTWGENLCLAAEAAADADEPICASDLEEAEGAAAEAGADLAKLRGAAANLIRQMDAALEGAPDDLVDRVNGLIAALEAEL